MVKFEKNLFSNGFIIGRKVIRGSLRDYIRKGISCGIRCDGRASLDSRKVILETGLIAQAAGSCRMKVIGGSHVLVGVKAQVGQINPQIISENIESVNIEAKDVGRIQCFVEW